MLVLDEVSYRYAGARHRALDGVTLELRDGEVVGLVGANESGKTTLCLVASGLAPRAIGGELAGRLVIDGADMAGRPMHELTPLAGIVFQDPATQRSGVTRTVYEEVAFGPANLGLPLDELIERTGDALAALAIDHLADRDPARLSGGQQQLVAIAGVLAMRPTHLVLDEPTAQLDPAGTSLVADAIARIAADGASILVAEHKTDVLARVASRVVALHEGRIAVAAPMAEVFSDSRLEAWLGVAAPSRTRLERMAAAAGVEIAGP